MTDATAQVAPGDAWETALQTLLRMENPSAAQILLISYRTWAAVTEADENTKDDIFCALLVALDELRARQCKPVRLESLSLQLRKLARAELRSAATPQVEASGGSAGADGVVRFLL